MPEGTLAIRGGAVRVVGYVVSVLVGLAAAPFLTRHLGVADYGRYVTVMSILVIVASITDAGLYGIGLREYAVRDPDSRVRFMRALLGMRITLTIVGIGAVVAALAFVDVDQVPATGLALAGAALILTVLQHTYAIPLAAELRLGLVSAFEVLRSVAMSAGTLALVAAGAGLTAFFLVQIPVGALVLVATLVVVAGAVPLVPSFTRSEVATVLRETLPFAAATALGVVFYRLAIVFLSFISSEEETGYFSAAFRVTETLTIVPSLLLTAIFPVISRAATETGDRLRYALQRAFEVAVILGCWFALATAVGADDAISVIAGESFEPSVRVLEIQAIALLATFVVATWGFALLAMRRHTALVVGNAVALVLAAVLTLVLAERNGAVGAAVAMAVAEFVLAALYFVSLVRHRPDLRASFRVVPRVAAAVLLALSVLLFDGLPPLVDVLLASVIYFVALFLLRAIPDELGPALIRRSRSRSGL